MHRSAFSVFPIGLLILVLVCGCSAPQDQSADTSTDSTLSEQEWSKIDPDLTRLMTDSVKVTDVPTKRRSDGTRVFAVWIRGADPGVLEGAGVSADSIHGGQVWTWLSPAEMREVAQLEAVERIRADNNPMPRKE